MRDFLYSEISNIYRTQNIPDEPDIALEVGRNLCRELLDPLNATFGRLSIRSAYRSKKVNERGCKEKLGCGSNENNRAGHIWDFPEKDKSIGGTACVVVPWFADRIAEDADWRAMAYWIRNHLPYSDLCFFPKLCAFNISWHQKPKRYIQSHIKPVGTLLDGEAVNLEYAYYLLPLFSAAPPGVACAASALPFSTRRNTL